MILLGNILLALATAITVWLPLVFGPRAATVPQTPAAAAAVTAPRWFCLVVALGVLVARGEFAWVANGPLAQGVVVGAAHMLSGVVSLASLRMATGRSHGMPVWLRRLHWMPPVLVPVVVIAYALASFNAGFHPKLDPEDMRPLLVTAVTVSIGFAAGLIGTRTIIRGSLFGTPTRWIREDDVNH